MTYQHPNDGDKSDDLEDPSRGEEESPEHLDQRRLKGLWMVLSQGWTVHLLAPTLRGRTRGKWRGSEDGPGARLPRNVAARIYTDG